MTHKSSVLFWLKLYFFVTGRIKIHQIPQVIFGTKSQGFFSNFASFFSVMIHNSSVLFHLKLYMLWTKGACQSTNFQTFECSNESSPNSSCHFGNHKVSVYSNFASVFSVMKDNFWTKRAHWKEIFRLLCGWVKIQQIPHAILEITSQFFFKLCITFQCHER